MIWRAVNGGRLIGSLIVLGVAGHPLSAAPYAPRVGEAHPQIVLPTIEGDRVVALSGFRGQKVLLIHFASWDQKSQRDIPAWNEKTKGLVDSKKLVVIGIVQEQHADRCRLYAQWQGLTWPILHDALDLVGIEKLPAAVAIDEYGIVRDAKAKPDTIAQSFALAEFPAPGKPLPVPSDQLPDPRITRRYSKDVRQSDTWRDHGDALVLAGMPPQIDEAIKAYGEAVRLNSRNAQAFFRLGVAYRVRFDRPERQPGDFQAAIDAWQQAAKLQSRNTIFRRRVQQYGPDVDKPFAFYDWVDAARQAITGVKKTPIALGAEPTPAERARPEKEFRESSAHGPEGDSSDKVPHDGDGLIELASTVVRGTDRDNRQIAEVLLTFRPSAKADTRWSNDAEPLRVWINKPKNGELARSFVEHHNPAEKSSAEERTLDFAIKLPAMQKRTVTVTGYALYNVRVGETGERRLLRQDFTVKLNP